MNPIAENIQVACARILQYLAEHKTASSWKLKITFQLPSSVLYMALGTLFAQGKITLEADELNCNVALVQVPMPAPAAAQPPLPPTL